MPLRDFAPLNEREPLDVEALLAAVPSGARVRALFLEHARLAAENAGCDASTIPRGAGGMLDMTTSMRGSLDVAGLLWPDLPVRGRLRRLGHLMHGALFESPVAKAIFRVAHPTPAAMLRMMPMGFRFANALGRVSVVEHDAGKYVLSFVDCSSFRDLVAGSVDAMLAATHSQGDVGIRARTETDFDLCVTWSVEKRTPPGRYGPAGEILIKPL